MIPTLHFVLLLFFLGGGGGGGGTGVENKQPSLFTDTVKFFFSYFINFF